MRSPSLYGKVAIHVDLALNETVSFVGVVGAMNDLAVAQDGELGDTNRKTLGLFDLILGHVRVPFASMVDNRHTPMR